VGWRGGVFKVRVEDAYGGCCAVLSADLGMYAFLCESVRFITMMCMHLQMDALLLPLTFDPDFSDTIGDDDPDPSACSIHILLPSQDNP